MISEFIKFIFLLILFLIYVTKVGANYEEFLEKINLEKMYYDLGPKNLLATFLNETNIKINLQNNCQKDLLFYTDGIKNNELWTLKMLDSSSKIPTGLLIGNVIELGMYDQCMSINVKKNSTEIIGNHCTYTIYLSYKNKTLPINPLLSICLPASCEAEDLSKILHKRIQNMGGYENYNITNIDVLCSDVYSRKLTGTIITTAVISVILVFLILCTILDSLRRKKLVSFQIPEFVREISLFKSTADIFSLKDNPGSITALHGLRFLSTSIVILGHGILIRAGSLHANNLHIAYLPPIQTIMLAFIFYSVDTFLTISGFLVSYVFLKKYISSKKQFKLSTYYLHRYIRLTPAIAAVLFVSIYIVPFIGSGPKWRKVTKDLICDICKEKMWMTLLYVNNIFYKEGNCLAHLWSTAVDMQLFLISPLILYPLAKAPKLGLTILGLLIVASVITPAVIIFRNNYPFSFYEKEACFSLILEMWANLYTQPHTRASPWLIGILLGYIVTIGPKELKKSTIFIGWLMTTFSIVFCTAGFWQLLKLDYEYNVIWETIFGSISRPIWSVATSWIIFTSVCGYGGRVNKFLSSPIFFPLSRLSFCLYLVHIVVQMTNSQISRTPTYFMYFPQVTAFLMDFLMSLIMAYFVCIVFEMPTRTLEKIINGESTGKQDTKKQDIQFIKENLDNNNVKNTTLNKKSD